MSSVMGRLSTPRQCQSLQSENLRVTNKCDPWGVSGEGRDIFLGRRKTRGGPLEGDVRSLQDGLGHCGR